MDDHSLPNFRPTPEHSSERSPATSVTLSDADVRDNAQDSTDDVSMWDDISESTPAVDIWVPTAFFHRLSKFLSYNDPHNERYNLGDIPAGCEWGPGVLASRLCRNGRVVHVWAIGHLRSMWFFTTLDDPRPAARVCLDLVREKDTEAARRLMGMANHSQNLERSWMTRVDFCADRMDAKNRKVFREVYDARARYAAKPQMRVLPVTDLSIGDLVLVECWFVRCRLDRSSRTWDSWTTAFQLRSLSVLLSRPPSATSSSAPHIDGDDGFEGYI